MVWFLVEAFLESEHACAVAWFDFISWRLACNDIAFPLRAAGEGRVNFSYRELCLVTRDAIDLHALHCKTITSLLILSPCPIKILYQHLLYVYSTANQLWLTILSLRIFLTPKTRSWVWVSGDPSSPMEPSFAISLLTPSVVALRLSFADSLDGTEGNTEVIRGAPLPEPSTCELFSSSRRAGGGGEARVFRWNDTDLLSFDLLATKPSTVGAFMSFRRSAPSGGKRFPLESSRDMRFNILFKDFLSGVSVLSGEDSGGETSSLGTWLRLWKALWDTSC